MSHHIQLKIEDELFNGSKDPFLVKEDDLPMQDLIRRIFTERGFLDLKEANLVKELNEANSEELDMDIDGSEKEDTEEPSESEEERIQKLKMDLTTNIGKALNETGLALDLVSLLISSTKPNLAKSTISPQLSKTVPLGSFGMSRLVPEENAKNDTNANTIGQGWKYESLGKIRDLFKNKRDEIFQHVQKEQVYWDSINKVSSNNEILLKMRDPQDNTKAIGVKYGFGDSGSSYHDKGIAILRRDGKTGEVSFNPVLESDDKLITKTFKYVKVKILSRVDDEYMLTGQSKFTFDIKESSDKLISDIEKARFFIFEEDLFYQLTREARTLINYNVQIISDKIIIEINNEIIEIEAIAYDESVNEEDLYQETNEQSKKNNQKCQLILNYLKIMLCGYFKYNLNLKQKIPTKYTKFKQHNSHPLILRPFIGHVKHEAHISHLQTIVDKVLNKYTSKLKSDVDILKYQNIKDLEVIQSPFIKSIEKPISKVILKLKNENGQFLKVDIDLTTSDIFVNLILNLKIIKFEEERHLNSNDKGTNVLKLTFSDFTDIEQCVDWSIQRFLEI